MKFFYIAIFACLCLCCSRAGLAQAVYGSTTLDIDAESNTVTATCETDADNFVAEYYKVDVSCVVENSSGNIVASGGGEDDSGQGYVQAVVTFTGVPGETYTAMSAHSVFAIFTVTVEGDDPAQPIRLHYYDDIYDFSFYSDDPQTYDNYFEWDSPGPETYTATSHEVAGNTEARGTVIKITYSGQSTNLVDTTQSAVVGQQIALTASYNLPTGVTVQSQSWSVPGTTIGGYTWSVNSGATTTPNFFQPSTTYYWVDAGTARSVTYTLTLSDGSTSSAIVPFDVSGPTSPSMKATLNPGGVTIDAVGNYLLLEFGNNTSTFGIIFIPKVTQPSGTTGTLSFVQLVTSEQEVIADDGPPPTNFSCTVGTGLDNLYPYHMRSDGTAADSPAVSLNSTYTELVRTFSATMYLMWNSGLPNSIPVPLGSLKWGFSADAYRDTSSSPWSLRNPTDSSQAFTAGIVYPMWNTHASNNNAQCH